MRNRRDRERIVIVLGAALLLAMGAAAVRTAFADEKTPAPAKAGATASDVPAETDALHVRQEILSRRYKRFEDTLLKLSEQLRKNDPERADLLRRAISKSKESLVGSQLSELVDLLKKDQFKAGQTATLEPNEDGSAKSVVIGSVAAKKKKKKAK